MFIFSGAARNHPTSPSFQSRFYTLLALPFPDQPRLARRELGGGLRGRAGAFSFPPSSSSPALNHRIALPRAKAEPNLRGGLFP